jgi:hypothetical protein
MKTAGYNRRESFASAGEHVRILGFLPRLHNAGEHERTLAALLRLRRPECGESLTHRRCANIRIPLAATRRSPARGALNLVGVELEQRSARTTSSRRFARR